MVDTQDVEQAGFESPLDAALAAKPRSEWHTPRVGTYHASQLPRCMYKQWLDFTSPSETYDASSARAMWFGSLVHREIERDLLPRLEKYVDFEPVQWERRVFWGLGENYPGAMIVGMFDVLARIDGDLYVVDIKTTKSLRGVEKYGPSEHYLDQLSFYMGAMHIHRGLLWYIGRLSMEDKMVEVEWEPNRFKGVVARARLLHGYLSSGDEPDAIPNYDWECNYCSRRQDCPRLAAQNGLEAGKK